MTRKLFTLAGVSALACALTVPPAWANYGGGYGGHEKGEHGMGASMMEMMMHGGAGHLIRHLLKHEKDIGLSAEQSAKLKELQLTLDKGRIKMEADIQVAERELRALTEDAKSDLSAIESKLKQSAEVQSSLRILSIKTRRDALALLTSEQRAKQEAEHEKMMQQHKSMGGDGAHGKAPHGSNPHGANPHGQGKPHGENPHAQPKSE